MEIIEIKQTEKQIVAEEAMLQNSTFTMLCLNKSVFHHVAMVDVKIVDANLTNLEIKGAQVGGAYIHNIGMPPEDHPDYDPHAKQAPVTFENCDLNGSTISNCNLSNITISGCNTSGMTINGVLVEEMLTAYRDGKVG